MQHLTRYSLRIAPINDALVRLTGCKAYKNPTVPNFTDLVWSKKPAEKSGAYHEQTLYVQYTKNQAVKKWLPVELICTVYLDYIVTIHFVCKYLNLLTLYVQYTRTLAVKKWLPFKLICTVDLENIVTINFVRPYPNLLTLNMFSGINHELTFYVQYTKNQSVKKWLPF